MPSYVRGYQWSRLTPSDAVNKQIHKDDRDELRAVEKAEMWWRHYMRDRKFSNYTIKGNP